MSVQQSSHFLRRVLILDAVASGATAALLVAAAGLIHGMLGLPLSLLRGAGLVLLPYVAFVAFVATRERIEPAAVWVIIVSNALWASASLLLLLLGAIAPTGLGIAFVVAQAAVVALLGELQYMGLRRPARAWRRKDRAPLAGARVRPARTPPRARAMQPANLRARGAIGGLPGGLESTWLGARTGETPAAPWSARHRGSVRQTRTSRA